MLQESTAPCCLLEIRYGSGRGSSRKRERLVTSVRPPAPLAGCKLNLGRSPPAGAPPSAGPKAQKAIDALDGHGYDHLILSVNWANPSAGPAQQAPPTGAIESIHYRAASSMSSILEYLLSH